MNQTPASYDDALPCPACGCTELVQHVTQSENLTVTENGVIEHIEPREYVDVQEVWCTRCDEKIWERE